MKIDGHYLGVAIVNFIIGTAIVVVALISDSYILAFVPFLNFIAGILMMGLAFKK